MDRKQRKREWLVERDLLPAPPAPPHPRPDGYGETDTRLTRILDDLAALESESPGTGERLLPGLTAVEISAATGDLPYLLPEEVYELYRWRNGSSAERPVPLVGGHWFMSLQDAMTFYRSCLDLPGWKKSWFTLSDSNGDEAIVVACKNRPGLALFFGWITNPVKNAWPLL